MVTPQAAHAIFLATLDRIEARLKPKLLAAKATFAAASRIQSVTDLSTGRAELIARTETHAAATYASVESVRSAQDRLGVTMLKSWLPTLDSRTRPAHADMAGSDPIPMDATFLVDGEELD